MSDIIEDSLASKLFSILLTESQITEEQLSSIKQGDHIQMDCPERIGRVLGAVCGVICYEPFKIMWHNKKSKWVYVSMEENLVGAPLYSYRLPEDVKQYPEGDDQVDLKYRVFFNEPESLAFCFNNSVIVSFKREDEYLEELLQQTICENPAVSSLDELKSLTKFVHNLAEYDKSNLEMRVDLYNSLGQVWKMYGRCCRQFSGFELAVLKLLGVDAKMLITAKKVRSQIKKSHVFLEVGFGGGEYIVDPVWNFVEPKDKYLKWLFDNKKKTIFHQEYEAVRISPILPKGYGVINEDLLL